MIEERLFELIDPVLRSGGAIHEAGEEFHEPALDVLRYYRRPVRWNPVPVLGRALSVVAVVRQPLDIELAGAGYEHCSPDWPGRRAAGFLRGKDRSSASRRWYSPPSRSAPATRPCSTRALGVSLRRFRVITFGILRINLGQEAIAWALKSSPDQLFPEPVRLADALGEHFRRFVPLIEM